jgi:hypothetical protein
MVICGNYKFEFNVDTDLKSMLHKKGGGVGKVATHLCLTLIVKELKNQCLAQ